jgi:hypothetical protein
VQNFVGTDGRNGAPSNYRTEILESNGRGKFTYGLRVWNWDLEVVRTQNIDYGGLRTRYTVRNNRTDRGTWFERVAIKVTGTGNDT